MSRPSRNARPVAALLSSFAIGIVLVAVTPGFLRAQQREHAPAPAVRILRSVSMVPADFDEDGVTDLAIGYATAKGGAIGLMRGNHDAIAPQTQASWLAAGRHELTTPFLAPSQLIQLTAAPDFLIAADMIGDGHRGLVFAASGSSQLQLLVGTGKGTFAQQPVSFTIPGAITALAAYRPGAPLIGEALLVGYQTTQGARIAIVSWGGSGLRIDATYRLPAAATAISVASLDGDRIPDAAIVAGGQLLILHGANAIDGGGRLETLPVDNVEAVTAGEFLIDRHGLMQLAALNANGDVLILAHQGFDPRPFTPQEMLANLSHGRGSKPIAPLASDTSGEPWTVVETNSLAGVHPAGSAVPILLRSRIGGSGGEDLVVLNAAQQQRVTISHPAGNARASASSNRRTVTSALDSDAVVAAASVRVNADGRPGLAVLRQARPTPDFTVPSAGNTFYPNTVLDNSGTTTDSDDGARCTQNSHETCTLRDAVVFANADAADNIAAGKSDTIMLGNGTYELTWQHGTLDSQSNAVTHLEVLGPVTIIGNTAAGTIINANNFDVAFTINPGPYGYYNPGTGPSLAFDTTLENITIENGTNPDNLANNGNANDVGGGINWDAAGTGNLNLDNVTITKCTVQYGAGGGLWIENSVGSGSGKVTLTGGTISNNGSPEQGGGVYGANPYATLVATNTTFSGNTSAPSVNTQDPGAYGAGGGLYFTGQIVINGSPQSTLTGVTISGNSATQEGGGVYTNTGLLISGATLSGNSSTGQGGGIYAEEGPSEVSTTITSSNILANSADAGGGVYVGNDNPSNSVPSLQMSLSRIFGNTATSGWKGLVLEGSGAATAKDNWWGCNAGPDNSSCDTADGLAITSPWAKLGLTGSPSTVSIPNSVDLTVSLNTDSNGATISGAFPAVNGESVTFDVSGVTATPSLTSGTFGSAGTVSATLTPSTDGSGQVTAKFDNQTTPAFDFTVGSAPAFTSAGSATFTVGTAGSFTVTTTGSPAPALSETDELPMGVTFTDNSNGTATLAGTPAAGTSGTYIVQFGASNGIGSTVYQTFTLTVNQAPAITSAASAIFTVGTAGTFTVTTTGSPTPGLSTTSTLPSGVTFTDNGNGTATLAGTPAAGTGGVYAITINATNGVGSAATQSFVLKVDQAPAITSANTTTFTAGASGSFTVTTSGYPAPSFSTVGPPLPSGFSFTDNGNGTASLTGTAAPNLAGTSYTVYISASNGVGQVSQQTFTLNIAAPPAFVVSNTNDSGTGSLRAALASAAAVGGSITFDPTVFSPGNSAAANTITLSSGTLTLPSNTTITGPTTGSGATLANLVTINGGTANAPIFTVTSSAIYDVLNNLIVTGGSANNDNAGGIYNGYAASLTVNNSTISNNSDPTGAGGVFNDYNATLNLNNCTLNGNSGGAGAIVNEPGGVVFVIGSTLTNNTATNYGGAILNDGTTLYVSGTTITGNSAPSGAGILTVSGAQTTLSNSIVSGNSPSGQDVTGPVTDNGGNVLSQTASLGLAPLGSYGGPTQTMLPLPGSLAFCAGTQDNAMAETTDQRGFARATTYPNGGTPITCVDAGADQTSYAMSFTTNPPATAYATETVTPAPVVTLTENSQAVTYSGGTVSITDAQSQLASPQSTLTESLASGAATFSNLIFPSTLTGDSLVASFTLTPSAAPTPVAINATSAQFNVTVPSTSTSAANAFAVFSPSAQTVTLSATVTSGGSNVNVGSVTFTLLSGATPVGTPTSGPLSNGSASVSYVLPGGTATGQYTIQAVYNASAPYIASSDTTHTLTIGKASQTINFNAPASPVTFGVAPITLVASATSALGVTFTIDESSTGTGTITGNSLTITGAGTLVIDANQPGNSNYTPAAQVQQTIVVNKSAQSISFTAPASPVTYGVAPVTLSATTTSGLGVTFAIDPISTGAGSIAGNVLTITGAGTLVIDANQSGNGNYLAAPQTQQTIVVSKATATVVLGSLAQTYSGSPEAATAVTTPNGLAVTLTYTGVSGTIYATSSTAPTNAGSYTVAATVNAANYTGSATGTLVIAKATATVTLGSLAQTYSGSPEAATATTTPTGLAVAFTYTGVNGTTYATSSTAPTGAGSYTVAATVNNANYAGTATGTLIISKAAATINLVGLTQTYSGSPESATATTTPKGLAVVFTYNGSATAPTNAGTYAVVATINDPNYAGSATGNLVIAQAKSSIALASSANPVLLSNPVVFTATVTSAAGTPTGSVNFYNGGTLLGSGTLSGGVATFTTSTLAIGYNGITAVYGGDTNFLVASSSTVGEVVLDFSISFSLPSGSVLPGGSASFTFTVTPKGANTFPSDITFTASGLPPGFTGTFSPNPITAGSGKTKVTFTLTANASARNAFPRHTGQGTELLAHRNAGTNGPIAKMAPFALALLLLPFAAKLRRAGRRLGRLMSVLLLLGAGLAAMAGLSGCGSNNGFFGQAPQNYTVTITATSGALSHSGTLTVTVE